jgi:hypothetical protein
MVADGSALVGSKEMSPLYTNAAADLFGRFQKNFRNIGFALFQGFFEQNLGFSLFFFYFPLFH